MSTDDPLRAALHALLHFQAGAGRSGLPGPEAAPLAAALDAFPAWCARRVPGLAVGAPEQAAWSRVREALVASALAQLQLALQGGGVGPITQDLALLLRAEGVPDDESAELDLAVRWWDGARRAGLPVDADFGECWRAFEWTALQHQLVRVAGLDPAAAADAAAPQARLLAGASKVALRYGPLKPLLRMLQAAQGAPLAAGFTF